MAALIKSIVVEADAMLLTIGAVGHRRAAAKIDANPDGHHLSVEADIVVKPVASELPPVAKTTEEVEAIAYRRLMAEHETQLDILSEQARREAYTAGYTEGEQSGHAAGLAKGEQQGQSAYVEAVAALEGLVQAGKDAIGKGLDDSESIIAEIVFQSVCKIVGDALITSAGVKAVVDTVLANAKRSEVVALKLAPHDLQTLLEHESRLLPNSARLRVLDMVADESIELGGCIVQLKGGHIDGRIETQFRTFAQSLKDAVVQQWV